MFERLLNVLVNVYGYSIEDVQDLSPLEIVRLFDKEAALASLHEKEVQITRLGKVYIAEKYKRVA